MFHLESVPGVCVHRYVHIGGGITILRNVVRKIKTLSCYKKLPICLSCRGQLFYPLFNLESNHT